MRFTLKGKENRTDSVKRIKHDLFVSRKQANDSNGHISHINQQPLVVLHISIAKMDESNYRRQVKKQNYEWLFY